MVNEVVPKEFCCAATGKPLVLPVVTAHGVAYSYLALYEMFMKAEGVVTCVETQEPIYFFPNVCVPLHHFMLSEYKSPLKGALKAEQSEMFEKFGVQLPQVSEVPEEDGEEGFLEDFQCAVSGELAYEPCALSSGSIVSASKVPPEGFAKDPNRLIACALHGQVPRKSATLEAMIKSMFPEEYERAANESASSSLSRRDVCRAFDPWEHIHMGLGCDGCGLWPIRGPAWEDVDLKDKVGFHLCDGCYKLGYHKRVMGGRFNQGHMPKNRMELVPEGFI
eukprot:TRINITY_DN24625_c0_g2_i1.p1 TRINITY_DN24625_c0_g2~~TRINITY_DN24625_c0_g2_i1.p1  ORF type:complete len:278 (-),score=51.72 TRINITY_DN24625_c0_g2_i1:282-1115(-)